MFGIKIKQIAEGWTNYVLGKETELSQKRLKICKKCPLYEEKSDRCDGNKCYNKETGEISKFPQKGFICGCNCYMKKATRSVSKKCNLGKW